MKVSIAVVLTIVGLSGCTIQSVKHLQRTSTFNAQEVAWFNKPGDAVLAGQALLRTNDGEIRTCAGLTVILVPRSAFATEHVVAVYGNAERGFRPIIGFTKDDIQYGPAGKAAICDAQGDFTFDNLHSGRYFVMAPVTWRSGHTLQGGVLMQSISLSAGESKHVVMTR